MKESTAVEDSFRKGGRLILPKESSGKILERHGIEEILRLLNKKGYGSREAAAIRREMERSKRRYDYLIRNQGRISEADGSAGAVIQYYLYQLEELRRELPYDAMGCGFTVPLMLLGEFQSDVAAERIMEFLGNPDTLTVEELRREIRKFTTVRLDPRGIVLYMDLLASASN